MTTSGTEHLSRLASWLLAQNSMAARLLADQPGLLSAQLQNIKPGRVEAAPVFGSNEDEELVMDRLRAWRTEGLLSLALALIYGKVQSTLLNARLETLTTHMCRACLSLADMTLRRRYHHPVLPPGQPGPGPVVMLNFPSPVGSEMGFDTPINLIFLFDRGQMAGNVRAEEDFTATLQQPKEFIILKDYILKLAQRVIAYLTLDSTQGPGLSLSSPDGVEGGSVGPQISTIGSFFNYYDFKANDETLLSLTRLTIMGGQPRLRREIKHHIKKLILYRTWDEGRLLEILDRNESDESEAFNPQTARGGLKDLGLLLDGLLLKAKLLPLGDIAARLKQVTAAGLLPSATTQKLTQALDALMRAHLMLTLLGQTLPGRDLVAIADLDAALTLVPGKTKFPTMTLPLATETVMDSFILFRG